jgi:hypothetical protein
MRYLVDEQPWTQVELDELIAGPRRCTGSRWGLSVVSRWTGFLGYASRAKAHSGFGPMWYSKTSPVTVPITSAAPIATIHHWLRARA